MTPTEAQPELGAIAEELLAVGIGSGSSDHFHLCGVRSATRIATGVRRSIAIFEAAGYPVVVKALEILAVRVST